MRKMFLTAAALAPLCIAANAQAETVISNTRTTPIATSTANSGSADDIRIDDGGKIDLDSGTAVTVDSDNDVVNDGGIEMTDSASGSTAILVAAGTTGDVTNNGTIIVDDGYVAEDTDKDGDLDGPHAEGTDRKGIWVAGPMTGDVVNGEDGLIRVEGNQSYGILIDGALAGDLINDGNLRVLGDGSIGIAVNGDVTGDITIGGDVSATGEGASAVVLAGDVNGSVVFDGAMLASGYRYTSRPTDPEALEGLDADDLLQGGPTIWVAGNVTGGVLFDRTPADLDPDNDDEDGDGVPDDEETTAQISSAGSAPALLIGSMTDTVTLGAVGTDDLAYGLVIKGNVTASGIYDERTATAVQLGMEGGAAVDIEGGVRIETGTVGASAFDANSYGMRVLSGVNAPVIWQDGELSATTISEGADNSSYALLLEAGANVGQVANYGLIQSTVIGEAGTAYGIVDQSGNLGLVENSGQIIAQLLATDDPNDGDDDNDDPQDETITGRGVAIDLSANTLGAVVRQMGLADGDDLNDGIDDPDADNDGIDDNDEPGIQGDIRFGSGADTLDIQNGTVFGNISFGAGADSLLIDGGGYVRGRIDDSDNDLAITVTNGALEAQNTAAVQVSSLTVQGEGDLIITVDPEAGQVSGFDVSGTATFADGAGFGVRFESLLQTASRFTVVEAGTLDAGTIDFSTLEGNTPYAYVATGVIDQANNAIYLDVRQRTAEEAGLIASEAAAYNAIYQALNNDVFLRAEFLSRLDRKEFMQLFRQLMPQHSGAPLLSLTAGLDAVRHALSDRRVEGERGEITAWLQEINFYATKEQVNAYAFESEGFGVAGGIEKSTGMGSFGLSFAYTSSDMDDDMAVLQENLTAQLFELGAYWRTGNDDWRLWARGSAGFAMFEETREVIAPTIVRRAKSDWNGFTLAAGAGGSYSMSWGKWYGRAEGQLEYFYLSEEAHKEDGGGPGFNLAYDEREGHILKAEATLNVGRRFGAEGWLTPEIRLGWRHNVSTDLGVTTARFQAPVGCTPPTPCGAPFHLMADAMDGGGPIIGFRLTAGSAMGFLGFEADAILIDDYELYSLMLRGGFRF